MTWNVRNRAPTGLSFALALAVALTSLLPLRGEAQSPSGVGNGPPTLPAVFLDCQGGPNCNLSQFQTEIPFVSWVRDRTDSDIHIIFTSQGVSGGREYTVEFLGRGLLTGMGDQLTYFSSPDDVQAETMDGLARTLRLGLLRFALHTGLGRALDIHYDGARSTVGVGVDAHGVEFDPWNRWSFRTSLSGDWDFRETRTTNRITPQFGADRVTDEWKINISSRADLRRDRRELADGRVIRDDRNDWRATGLFVRSLSDHMGVGVDTDVRNSLQRNQRLRVRVNPAVEYNYFPYAQATRRQFIVHYSVGVEHSEYVEQTILGVESETLPLHRLGVQYRVREPWGNAGVGLDANQYLHDRGFYGLGVSGEVSYRVARGLELTLSGGYAITEDNFYTPAGDISDEDILLGRQSLPSSYRYEAAVGFSYRWGSALANVVNHRFPGSVRW